MTDPIADLLTRIRNALMRSKETVNAPYSKLKHELAKLLVKEGFLHSVKKVKKDFDELEITLKYFEEETQSNYLIDNLLFIKNNFTENEFIFLMGSDSFIEIDKWKDYDNIFKEIRIAIFNRGSNINQINSCIAGIEYNKYKFECPGEDIFKNKLPCWTFISDFNIKISSSEIRK